jgi:superfamily II helicase
MSNQKICDLCGEIIVDRIFYISITEAKLLKNQNKMIEFITLEKTLEIMQEKHNETTSYFEICDECKRVFEYLVTMRIDNLRLLKNEVNGILRLPFKKEGRSNVR